MTKIIKPMIDSLKPQGRPGRRPLVRHCPHCHAALNVTQMKAHLPQCEREHRNAPPQPPHQEPPPAPLPADLENQELSRNSLERTRQLDQQEQDRIERTMEE